MKASLTGIGTILVATILCGCGGGGGSQTAEHRGSDTPPPPPANFSIGGSVSGLPNGAQLSLLDNGASTQAISTNGPFTLTATLTAGSAYSVSIGAQPAGYQCNVTGGSGTMPARNVTDVAVTCTQITATVGGSVEGLLSSGLVLANGDDTFEVPVNAETFTMPKAIAVGTAYEITVRRSPTATRCAVSNGSGTGGDSPVTSVAVSCEPGSLSVLHSFADNPDGSAPLAGVIQARDGNFYGITQQGGVNGRGTVFKLTPAGEQAVLWSFGAGLDGSLPMGSLLQGSDGNLYGTTLTGGAYGYGTAFKISLSGSETVLWSFGGSGCDGRSPSGNLLEASDGSFYGMTNRGGTGSEGTIFRLTPDGAETVMFSLDNNGGPSMPELNGLILDNDGTFYGVSEGGGDDGFGTLFKITPDGAMTRLHSFDRDTGDLATGSLIEASDGNFYGVTRGGGTYDLGVIFQLTPSGTLSVLHSFGADGDGDTPGGGLIQASDGNLYGVTCGYDSGTLFRFTLEGTETLLYTFQDASTSGTCPLDRLVEAEDGSLYGVTGDGGAHGAGTVYRID